MRLQQNIDFTTLAWVKPELDETLRQARQALEAYVESGQEGGVADANQMRFCATYLHQVQGTLRMVELYGAAMVAEEMEQLARVLLDGAVVERDEAYTVLMRGIVQLPDYLERLQTGHRDIPIVLLPLLNELRSARGEKGLSESVLFNPDLGRPLPPSARGPLAPMPDAPLRAQAEALRARYQGALLNWLRDDENPGTISALADVCQQLVGLTQAESARRLFWVAAGTLDALRERAFEPSKPLKQSLARVEREIKRLADGGEHAFRTDPPLELTRQLLYFVAHAPTDHGRIGEIREVFGLNEYIPSEAEVEHARGSMSGHNRALLDTVAAAIKEDLLRVKDALDLHLRTHNAQPGELGPQVEVLDRVADTLGMLGLGVPRRVVQEQREAISAVAGGNRDADEATLLDIAGALLYVEASLDDQVARLGQPEPEDERADALSLPSAEAQKVLEAVVKEAIGNFAAARQCFIAFVETNWDHGQLTDVPRLLDEVAGALRILELEQPPQYLTAVRRFTETELLQRRRVPNGQQMDVLADALAALEYFLEALRDHRSHRERILEVARQSLEGLGYWPLPAEAAAPEPERPPLAVVPSPAPVPEPSRAAGPPPSAAPVAASKVVPAAVTPPAAPAEPAAPPTSAPPLSMPTAPSAAPTARGFEGGSEDIDDEIREVFLEEFGEEIGNLEHLLPPWRAQPENAELLRPIRRVFHTLKGSGRLVGALTLGEFSWKVENMLNRVLDGTRPASPAVIALVDHAFNAMPQLHAALRGEGLAGADLGGIKAVADRVAAGEEAWFSPPSPGETAAAAPEPAVASVVAPSAPAPVEPAQTPVPAAVAGVPASIDPVLFEILKAEVAGHLATIDAWLIASGDRPQTVPEALLRAVHTLNGAFAMTEVPLITELTAPVEGYIKRLMAHKLVPDAAGVALVADTAAAVRATVAALDAERPQVPLLGELPARALALRDALPEPTAPTLPLHIDFEDEDEHIPQAVSLGAPDLSALPDFASEPPVPEELAGAALESEPDFVFAEHLPAESTPEREIAGSPIEMVEVAEAAASPAAVEAERIPPIDEPAPVVFEFSAIYTAAPPAEATPTSAAGAVQPPVLEPEPEAHPPEPAEQVAAGEIAALATEAFETDLGRSLAEDVELQALEAADLDTVSEAPISEHEAALAAMLEAYAVEAEGVPPADEEPVVVHEFVVEEAIVEEIALTGAGDETTPPASSPVDSGIEGFDIEEIVLADADVQAPAGEALESQPEIDETATVALSTPVEDAAIEVSELVADQDSAEIVLEAGTIGEPSIVEAPVAEEPVAEEPVAEDLVAEQEGAYTEPLPALAEAEPDPDEPLDLTDLDTDLLDIFLEESADLLDHSDGLLANLRVTPTDRELVVGLQRDLHTLKGGARMAGIMAIGELGHAMESLLEVVADGRRELDGLGVVVLERAFDRLHAMVTRVGERLALALPATLIAQVDALARGESPTEAVAVPTEPEAEAPTGAAPLAKAEPDLTPLSEPLESVALEDEEAVSVRAPAEQVRIRADLLDRLVNYAGEVAIYRARLEQQLGAFRGNLSELDQTNTRLREQLRKLEIETEAQIIARYQREPEATEQSFDPLELDRFSTLQQLTRALSESAADLVSLQSAMDDLTRQHETLLLQQSRVSSDLQEGLMRTRMVPFDALVPRLRRVLRQAAGETGKQVQIKVDGAHGEMDRNVLERMTAPLEHMLRNAVAHGLETPAERRKAKKPEEGTVRVTVHREGSEVVITVADDGRGLNAEAIRKKAVERGLLKADAVVSDQALYAFILETGFSTAESVSRLAGRGVGMDVVHSEIRQLGGSLQITSQPGKGSAFTIRLPFTLAVTQAVFVKIGDTQFAVPIASVQGVGRIGRGELEQQLAGDQPVYGYAGEDYAIHDLGRLLGHAPAKAIDSLQMPLLLARSGDQRAAICIDQVLGSREIVVKPVGPQVNSIPGIFGATIMGDGSVVVILDVAPLVRRQAALAREAAAAAPVGKHEVRRVPLVMVVDDSITMRKVTGRVLERHNFEVLAAKDGVDAIEKMAERVPDLMLLDIEMPRMDGYELATHMKNDARLKGVPIIMITSRTGEKHRQRAMEIGVDRYLGKPYQEQELLRQVFDLLAAERAND